MRIARGSLRALARPGVALLGLVMLGPVAPVAASADAEGTYLVNYESGAQADAGEASAHGHRVVADLGRAGVLVVKTSNPAALATLPGVKDVVADVMVSLPDLQKEPADGSRLARKASGCASTRASCPLQWDLDRIGVPDAWRTTQGDPSIKVAVLDTGLNSKHEEVGSNYDLAESRSFVKATSCTADRSGVSSPEDDNGHGTWTNTHVAGRNGPLMTGIAPGATLVNLKVLNGCGSGFLSWILSAMIYANNIGARIISMSLGGYICADTAAGCSAAVAKNGQIVVDIVNQVVDALAAAGTVVIAAAGNDHVSLDANGKVTTHGSLARCAVAPAACNDLFALTEFPGGARNAVAVAATNRVTGTGSALRAGTGPQYGVGSVDQLTYYSSYGPKILVSAPGGSRHFNVPAFDCITAECRRLGPSAPGASDNPGDFGAFAPAGCNKCYDFIQGTSMATPQVAGVAALILSAHPDLTVAQLVKILADTAQGPDDDNATPPVAGTAGDPGFNFDIDYDAAPVPNALMGAGIVSAAEAVQGAGRQGDQGTTTAANPT